MNKISHPLAFSHSMCSPAGYCEPDKFQLWTEDGKSDGTPGVQGTLEGQTLMGFSG